MDPDTSLVSQWLWCAECERRFYVPAGRPPFCPVCWKPGTPFAPTGADACNP